MQVATGNLQLWLIRHGETEWSASGAHTSRSDIPLTAHGEESAAAIGHWLAGNEFSLTLVSPRQRARETCGSPVIRPRQRSTITWPSGTMANSKGEPQLTSERTGQDGQSGRQGR